MSRFTNHKVQKRIYDANGKVGKAHLTGFMDLTELEVLDKSLEENLAEKKRKSELKRSKASSISCDVLSVYYHTNFFNTLSNVELKKRKAETNPITSGRKHLQSKVSSISRYVLSVYYHTNFFTFRSIH